MSTTTPSKATLTDEQVDALFEKRKQHALARFKEQKASGGPRHKARVTIMRAMFFSQFALLVTSAVIADGALPTLLVLGLGVTYHPLQMHLHKALFATRVRRNAATLLATLVVVGVFLVLAPSLVTYVLGGIVLVLEVVCYVFYVLNYSHLTGRDLRTGVDLEEPSTTS